SVPDDAEPGGTVVVAPGDSRRRERAGDVALVRRRIRREKREQLTDVLHPSAEEVAEQRGVGAEERLLFLGVPPAEIDWAARAGELLVPLGHERHRVALLPGDLLRRVLVDGVAVGALQRLGVAQSDLLLPRPPLALRRFDRHAGTLQMRADRADQRLLFRP